MKECWNLGHCLPDYVQWEEGMPERKCCTFKNMGLKLGSQKHEMAKTHTDQANFWLCYFFHRGTEEENTHQHLYLPVSNDTFHSKLVLGLEKRLSNC